jgi:hypothetical protein
MTAREDVARVHSELVDLLAELEATGDVSELAGIRLDGAVNRLAIEAAGAAAGYDYLQQTIADRLSGAGTNNNERGDR